MSGIYRGFRCVENMLVTLSSGGSYFFSNWNGADCEYHMQELCTGDVSRAFLSYALWNCSFLTPNGLVMDPHRLWMDLCRR